MINPTKENYQDLVNALDAMISKRLITNQYTDGQDLCAAEAWLRYIEDRPRASSINPSTFIERPTATEFLTEIITANDELPGSPEERWRALRAWAANKVEELNR